MMMTRSGSSELSGAPNAVPCANFGNLVLLGVTCVKCGLLVRWPQVRVLPGVLSYVNRKRTAQLQTLRIPAKRPATHGSGLFCGANLVGEVDSDRTLEREIAKHPDLKVRDDRVQASKNQSS